MKSITSKPTFRLSYCCHGFLLQYYLPCNTGDHSGTGNVFIYLILYKTKVIQITLFIQECGIGSQCRTLAGVNTCPTCPGGTICIQNTVSSDFYCQYTFCLPQSMMCGVSTGYRVHSTYLVTCTVCRVMWVRAVLD